jgi:hypothetical protein
MVLANPRGSRYISAASSALTVATFPLAGFGRTTEASFLCACDSEPRREDCVLFAYNAAAIPAHRNRAATDHFLYLLLSERRVGVLV